MNPHTLLRSAPAASLCLLALVTPFAIAQSAAPARWPAEAIIRFSATSTLHDFAGTLPAQPFVITVVSNTWSAEADVSSGLMNTASEGRDKNMHKMLSTNDHPFIHGKVAMAPKPVSGGTNATLSLKICEQQHDLPVLITDWSETDGKLSFHAEWDLSLKQYKLKPPSVIGIIRVGDTVHLSADVTASRTSALTNRSAAITVPSNPQ